MMAHPIIKPLATIFAVMSFGATHVPAQLSNTSPTARIRLFGQNGVSVKLYRNTQCAGGEKIMVSGGIGDAFSSFLGVIKNESIGMPDTPNSADPASRNGLMSKAYFREYEVPAGQPLIVSMSFMNASAPPSKQLRQWSQTAYCKTITTTFVPERGRDYEGILDVRSDLAICVQQINEIKPSEEGIELQQVDTVPAETC